MHKTFDMNQQLRNQTQQSYEETSGIYQQLENQTQHNSKYISDINTQSENQMQLDFTESSGTNNQPGNQTQQACNKLWAPGGNAVAITESSTGSEYQSEKMLRAANGGVHIMREDLDGVGSQGKPSSVGKSTQNNQSPGGSYSANYIRKRELRLMHFQVKWDDEEDFCNSDASEDGRQQMKAHKAFKAVLRGIKVIRNVYMDSANSFDQLIDDLEDIIYFLDYLICCLQDLLNVTDERVSQEEKLVEMVKCLNYFGLAAEEWTFITTEELRMLYELSTNDSHHPTLHPLLNEAVEMAADLQKLH